MRPPLYLGKRYESGYFDRDDAFDSDDDDVSGETARSAILDMRDVEKEAEDRLSRVTQSLETGHELAHLSRQARAWMYTFLDGPALRVLFMWFMRNPSNWKHANALFGAPPYYFLHEGDASFLRAAGIARSRQNMVYEKGGDVPYAAFGNAHFVDERGREYKMLPTRNSHSETDAGLPWNIRPGKVVCLVRARKGQRHRAPEVESTSRFVTLRASASMRSANRIFPDVPSEASARVLRVAPSVRANARVRLVEMEVLARS
jgi:hypothetical protein